MRPLLRPAFSSLREIAGTALPLVELGPDGRLEQLLGLCLLRALDVDLGLDDRDQAVAQDLPAHLELGFDQENQVGPLAGRLCQLVRHSAQRDEGQVGDDEVRRIYLGTEFRLD